MKYLAIGSNSKTTKSDNNAYYDTLDKLEPLQNGAKWR